MNIKKFLVAGLLAISFFGGINAQEIFSQEEQRSIDEQFAACYVTLITFSLYVDKDLEIAFNHCKQWLNNNLLKTSDGMITSSYNHITYLANSIINDVGELRFTVEEKVHLLNKFAELAAMVKKEIHSRPNGYAFKEIEREYPIIVSEEILKSHQKEFIRPQQEFIDKKALAACHTLIILGTTKCNDTDLEQAFINVQDCVINNITNASSYCLVWILSKFQTVILKTKLELEETHNKDPKKEIFYFFRNQQLAPLITLLKNELAQRKEQNQN